MSGRSFSIEDRGIKGFGVTVAGREMRHLVGYRVERELDHVPVLTLEYQAVDVSRMDGEGRVVVTASGVEFTWEDVDALRNVAQDAGAIYDVPERIKDLAERIESLLPPKEGA